MTEIYAQQIQSIEQRALAIVNEFNRLERDTKKVCKEIYSLHIEFVARGQVIHNDVVFTSFFDWLEALGMPRATAYNYLNAGYAINAGLDSEGKRTLLELYDLGSALRNGATVEEAANAASAAKLAESKRNAGLVRIAVPEMFASEAESLAERMLRLELAPAKPEAIGLALLICNTLSDAELQSLAARQS